MISQPTSEGSHPSSGLKAYRLRALALTSAAMLAQKAEAQLVSFPINTTMGWGGHVYFNPIDGATFTTGPLGAERFFLNFVSYSYCGGYIQAQMRGPTPNLPDDTLLLAQSYSGAGPRFISDSGVSVGSGMDAPFNIVQTSFNYGQSYYAGFQMTHQGAGSATYYGWAEFRVNDVTSLTLLGVAYSTVDGQTVLTGIPEPAHAVSLLAAGAGGLALLRRRRRERPAVTAA